MELKPQFVTVDDFTSFFGIDLRSKLKENDNASNAAELFLYRIEDRLKTWIDTYTFRVVPFHKLTPFQREKFQKAILYQAMYVLRNGDLGLDSGYDSEQGVVAERGDLTVLSVCETSIEYLKSAGLYNQKIQNRKRWLSSDSYGNVAGLENIAK